MKKTYLYIAILTIGILALGGAGFVYARSQAPQPYFADGFVPASETAASALDFVNGSNVPFEHRGKPGGPLGFRGWGDSLLAPYIKQAAADALGLSVDELETRLNDGERPRDIIEAQGLTIDEFKTAMEAAQDSILDQAVEDGVITQVWANWLRDTRAAKEAGEDRPENPLKPYYQEAVAATLGISVDELEAYKDSGKRPAAILEELGLTPEELRTALQDAHETALAEAVADGVITQAQADQISERPGMFGGHFRGGHFGGHRGGKLGPRGGRGPQGFPGDQQPPAESPAGLIG